jgi:16S rRNA (uracil1498-N3)-methyltransferase
MHIPRLFLMPEDVRQVAGEPVLSLTAGGLLDLQPGDRLEILSSAIANQIKNVLRLRDGDKVIVLNGGGLLFECSLLSDQKRSLSCQVDQRRQLADDRLPVAVALAVLKGERFDWALQKLTELGVDRIVPILAARGVVKIDSGDAKGTAGKLARWQAIVREAAEQCERATIPQVVAPVTMQNWLGEFSSGSIGGIGYICAERIPAVHLRDALLEFGEPGKNSLATTDKTIFLLIGPEGGFTDDEVVAAQNAGLKPVSLGRRILRSETAAIYGMAQLIWCLEK